SYTGRLTGKLRLKLPTGRWVTVRSLRAETHGQGKVTCKDGNNLPGGDGEGGDGTGRDDEPRLMLNADAEGGRMMFLAERGRIMLTRTSAERRERGATVQTMSSAHATGSNLLRVSGGGAGAAV